MPQPTPTPQNPILALLPLIIIFVIFYLLLILPQQRKQRKHQEMIEGLKPGDEIVTIGGLYGTIKEVKAETFMVEIAPKVIVRLSRQAVSHKAA